MKQKVFVSQPLFADVIERLREVFEVDVYTDEPVPAGRMFEARLADKDGALLTGERIDAAILAAAPSLKVVSNMAVGYNNFDLAAMNAAHVLGTNTPDVLNEATADFGWTLLMAAARRVTEAERWLRDGQWGKWKFDGMLGRDIYGTTLGVIGMGRIGQSIARRARGFSMRVVYHNRSRVTESIEHELGAQYLSKDELLASADHVVLVAPYTAANHHMIGRRELGLMKPTASLINIARGGIVDDVALIDALRERRIACAGLDVFEGEPALNPAFLGLDNVALTPHIASATETARRAMARLAAENLIAALGHGPHAGRPPNPVNPEVLGKTRQ